MRRDFYEEDHDAFRSAVREFVSREVVPDQLRWEEEGRVDPALWRVAGRQGLLGLAVPEEYGGSGAGDYRYRCVFIEELARVGAASVNSQVSLVDDLALPYLLDLGGHEQKKRWLPGLCAGELSPALAITEPGAGSDLRGIATTARRDGDGWRLNGAKTFITNGGHADVLVVVARTGPEGGNHGFSLLLVERGTPGFSVGRNLDKIGQRGENVAELFFDDVRLPAEALLGEEGEGLRHLREHLPTERMSIAVYALAAAEAALDWTLDFVRQRTAFGRRIADFQNTRFELAEMRTEIDVTRSFVQDAVLALNAGELSAVDAAKAKWWTTELQQRVISRCVQLHGGYGYMREYPIARAFVDARIQTIYGGTTEIMKGIIGRDLVRD
ncbi:acyl-CoA dehydrogenase family protein [Microtetraspora fusca]|uniref:acyl-CoA dehydrogenase family protein n=1 Tax=Microtetraspora fusca TaxID=1997 RepID=UPI0008357A7B|nr:acyl-CoA dehydrogenase family protein [Microtetraspora fusca]